MGIGVAEEDTIGHNAGTSATRLKHPHKEGHKEKFGLGGLGNGGQRLADDFLVERSGKRRIGQTEGIAVGIGIVGRKGVLVRDIGIIIGKY